MDTMRLTIADELNALAQRHRRPGVDQRPACTPRERAPAEAFTAPEDYLPLHLQCLEVAFRFDLPALYSDCVSWTRRRLAQRVADIRAIRSAVQTVIPTDIAAQVEALTEEAWAAEQVSDRALSAENAGGESPGTMQQELLHLLLNHQTRRARELILGAVERGLPTTQLYDHVITPLLREVGRLWETGEIIEAEEHFCSGFVANIIEILSGENDTASVGRLAVCFSIGEELHDLGLRMIGATLSEAGWETICLGARIPSDNIAEIISKYQPDLLAISATMSPHLVDLHNAVRRIRGQRLAQRLQVLVGGRPFLRCPELARKIGADGTAQSCADLLKVVSQPR